MKKDEKKESEIDKIAKVVSPKTSIVKYGGKDFEVKLLKPKQLMGIVKIISRPFGLIPKEILVKLDNQALVLAIIENMDEMEIYDLVKIILDCTLQEATEGYSIVSFMKVVSTVMENEDIQEIFFQITRMLKAIGANAPQE